MPPSYILKTNNFAEPRIWVARAFLFVVAIICLEGVKVVATDSEMMWVVSAIVGGYLILLLLKPTDELTLDNEKLSYIRKSIIPLLTRKTAYRISDIKSIAIGGKLQRDSIFYQLVPNFYALRSLNKIQLTLKDDSVISHHTSVYKKDLEELSVKFERMLR